MSNKVLMTEDSNGTSQKPVATVAVPERPVYEIEEILKGEEGHMLKREQVIPGIKVERKGTMESTANLSVQGVNALNKGSKLTGNLTITQDLEINGDVEGDITSEENSNIFIKGTCKGNIRTKGSVEIEGDMSGGDIVAGGYVKITGKFHGGKVQAKERIHINGEFSGTLESNEIEVGSGAQGKGELFFKEDLSIQKGAKVEGRITRIEMEQKEEVKPNIEAERKPELVQKFEMTQKIEAKKKEEAKPKKGFFSRK